MTLTRESFLDQITHYVARNRVISKRITQFLQRTKYSTEHPAFFKSDDMSILVNPEQQPDGKFRINVAIHSLPPGRYDLSGFRIGIITADGQRISGRNRGRGYTAFEHVPAGKFTLENWSVMRGREECYSRETLLGYVQNWMTPEESRTIKAHLHYCRDCALLAKEVEQEKAAAVAIIWPVQWLNRRAQEGIESIMTNSRTALKKAGEWIQMLLTPEPQLVPVMRTRNGVRQISTVEARILDESGNPTGQTLPLFVESVEGAPHIDEKRRFRVELTTSDLEYEGYTLQIALQNENGRLELCSIHFRKRDEKLIATALVPISDMFPVEEGQVPSGHIPIEMLDVTLQPAPQDV